MALGVVLLALVLAWDLTWVQPPSRWVRADEETAAVLRAHGLAPDASLSWFALAAMPVHAAGRQV